MFSIAHRVKIDSSKDKLFECLTTQQGLARWWTDNQFELDGGNAITFFFGENGAHQVTMEVLLADINRGVQWRCTSGPWAEKGVFEFQFDECDEGLFLLFTHRGWPDVDDFYRHCNSKWGFFLAVSLKNYLEKGTGSPHPLDPSI